MEESSTNPLLSENVPENDRTLAEVSSEDFSADHYSDSVVNDPGPSSPTEVQIRKSQRFSKKPLWLIDYINPAIPGSKQQHYMSNYLSYDALSATYQAYLSVFSFVVEPQSFLESSKDIIWVEAMQLEIQALQENNTWELVQLPSGKRPIGYENGSIK